MIIKLLEVRDRATFLPVFAISTEASNEGQRFLLRASGYSQNSDLVLFGRLRGGDTYYDTYAWKDRTMTMAHEYIEQHFHELKDGDVIDVEYILGETQTKKVSERHEL